MHKIKVALALFLLFIQWGVATPSSDQASHVRGTTRIVGGVAAAAGEFPFIVSLQKGTSHFCGGSLIAPSWVLTAAHCMGSGTSNLKIRIGLLKQGDTTGVETFSAAKVIRHPDYSKSNSDYDFALIQLSGESSFAPARLNINDIYIPDEETEAPLAVTAGWGTTSSGGSLSSKLLKVEVPLVSAKNCEIAYGSQITKTMICAGMVKGGKDACQGDSGGPLVIQAGKGQNYLLGVVSWGEGCAKPKKYGVYSHVYSAVSWILSHIHAQ